MRSTPSLVKYLTLGCFIILLSGFVAYRSGAFDKYLHTKAGYSMAYNLSDTSGRPDTNNPKKAMMSGSKAMILSENYLFAEVSRLNPAAPSDSAQYMKFYRELKRIKAEDSVKQHKEMIRMSSSKSMVIMKPEDLPENRYKQKNYLVIDGVHYYLSMLQVDSLLVEMEKGFRTDRTSQILPDSTPKTIWYGTKSGGIFPSSHYKKPGKKKEKKQKKSAD